MRYRPLQFRSAYITLRFSFAHSTDPDHALTTSSALSLILFATSLFATSCSPPLCFKNMSRIIQAYAYAPGTLRNLRSQWKTYLHFCHCFSLTPLLASASTISCFLVHLSRKTASYQYQYVRLLHLHHGFACDFLNSFSLALTKKGLKRVMGINSR